MLRPGQQTLVNLTCSSSFIQARQPHTNSIGHFLKSGRSSPSPARGNRRTKGYMTKDDIINTSFLSPNPRLEPDEAARLLQQLEGAPTPHDPGSCMYLILTGVAPRGPGKRNFVLIYRREAYRQQALYGYAHPPSLLRNRRLKISTCKRQVSAC